MKRFCLLPLLLVFSNAYAADYPRDLTLSWVNPSAYEDGTPLLPGELVSVRLECVRGSDPTPVINVTLPAGTIGAQQSEALVGAIPIPGTYACWGYAIPIDADQESVASNTASKKFTGKPLPLTTFTVE